MERYASPVPLPLVLLAQLTWSPLRPPRAPAPPPGEVDAARGDEVATAAEGASPEAIADAQDAGGWRRVVRADATAGWSSNARQIASEDGRTVFPNAALLGAVQLQGSLTKVARDGGTLRFDGSALYLRNLALDAAVPPNDGSANLRVQYGAPLTARSEGAIAASGGIGSLAARRASDPRMAAIDPSSADRTYANAALEAAWLHALTPSTRFGVGATLAGIFTVKDEDVALGTGRTLRHRGLDLATISGEAGVTHELSLRWSVEGLVRHLHAEAPFAIDLSTGTARNVGPLTTDVTTGLVGAAHELSERVHADVRAGVSLATPVFDDPDRTPYVEPAALARASYDDPRRRLTASVGYQYDAAIPRLGAGPTLRGQILGFGVPYEHDAWRPLNVLVSARAERSETRTALTSALVTTTAGATLAVRYGFGRHWGAVAGLDLLRTRFEGRGLVPANYERTLVFIGASWFDTNGRDERTLVPFGDMPF
jgi:hypothetical protein